jgi:phosphoesterase family protein/KAP-like P-loop domain-containing protein
MIATAGPIHHVVIIVKESHSFDAYFGKFPGADGDPTLAPAPDPPDRDYPHSHQAWLDRAKLARRQQYGESDIPAYYQYARQFTLCDRYFSEVTGPATPNHMMLIGASSPFIYNPPRNSPDNRPQKLPSLPENLETAGLTWRNYGGYAFPFFESIRKSPFNVTSARFVQDAMAGNLPAVSWVYPDQAHSEHPSPLGGGGSVREGMKWTVDQVDAVVQGGLWPEVTIFITWDMYGGWADHVDPPVVEPWTDGTPFRYGSRVPCLVLSPYAKAGHISSEINSHVSLLAYCERLLGLQALNDKTAKSNAMADCFDMAQAPLPAPRAKGYQPESRIATDIWVTQDRLGRDIYVDGIAQFIQHADTRPPLTIGVSAPWGAGKTSLMRMIREKIDPKDDAGNRSRIVVREGAHRELLLNGSTGMLSRIRSWGEVIARRGGPGSQAYVSFGEGPAQDDADDTAAVRTAIAQPTVGTALRNSRLDAQPVITAEHVDLVPAEGAGASMWNQSQLRPTVWFNPWMYETGEQIWAGLSHEILTEVTSRMEPGAREYFWLALNLRRLDRDAIRQKIYQAFMRRLVVAGLLVPFSLAFALGAALFGLARVSGLLVAGGSVLAAVLGVVGAIRFQGQKLAGAFPSLVAQPDAVSGFAGEVSSAVAIRDPAYESRTGFLELVQTDMKSVLNLVATEEQPLVVFVDDLDRCSSQSVAQVIEAINLFLAGEFPNCIFVLALDPDLVAAQVEIAYKDLVDKLAHKADRDGATSLGWRFLDKIVQLPVRLPAEPGRDSLGRYLDSLVRPTGSSHEAIEQVMDQGPKPLAGPSQDSSGSAPATRSPVALTPSSPPPAASLAPVDPNLVATLAMQIRNRAPGVGNINDVARWVQETALKLPATAPLAPATRAAARVVYGELFRDENVELRDLIVKAVDELPSRNPRAIKRLINLFRFYAFIAAERQFAGLPAPTLDQSVKLALLTVRWPQLLSLFGQHCDDGKTWLSHFEAIAQAKPTSKKTTGRKTGTASGASPGGPKAWHALLERARLLSDAEDNSYEDLRVFLATDVVIGDVASSFI